jgi:3-oxoacyl-[acyl-carrier-protein] synthase II
VEKRGPRIDPIWITDSVVVTSLGDSLEELWSMLLKGRTGIRYVHRFPTHNYVSGLAAYIDDLETEDDCSLIHGLLDRLFASLNPLPQDCYVITASTKAGLDNLERLRRGLSANQQDILTSNMPDLVSQRLGLKSSGININAACASSTVAIAQGASLIATGRFRSVLVCCFDLLTEFVFAGFSSLRAMSSKPCRPFDRDREGLTLGEGAAALLMMSRETAINLGRPCLGSVLGWAAANDAFHVTAPAIDGSGLIKAAKGAIENACLVKEDISAICAHGTGTPHNDMMELKAFSQVMGDFRTPIFSVKGAIGHTLGAAGGIETAVCLESLEHQLIPPTIGFSNPEEGAEGVINSKSISIKGDYILTTSSGFGGVNAALVLGGKNIICP